MTFETHHLHRSIKVYYILIIWLIPIQWQVSWTFELLHHPLTLRSKGTSCLCMMPTLCKYHAAHRLLNRTPRCDPLGTIEVHSTCLLHKCLHFRCGPCLHRRASGFQTALQRLHLDLLCCLPIRPQRNCRRIWLTTMLPAPNLSASRGCVPAGGHHAAW